MTNHERELLLLLVSTVAGGSKNHDKLYDLAGKVREEAQAHAETITMVEARHLEDAKDIIQRMMKERDGLTEHLAEARMQVAQADQVCSLYTVEQEARLSAEALALRLAEGMECLLNVALRDGDTWAVEGIRLALADTALAKLREGR
jgi:N-acetylglucosamine kinase-like BadF-type ATPase